MQVTSNSDTRQVHENRAPVDSVTRRLAYSLALVPIVPAAAGIGVYLTDTCVGLGPFDGLRWFHLFFSIFWVGATICIWRRLILWTLGRKWLTALVSTIPFAQVMCPEPFWGAGWLEVDTLRIGQHEIGIGLWVWLAIWVWWGWEKREMSEQETHVPRRIARMTPTAKRLAASIGTIPFIFGVFLIILVALNDLFAPTDLLVESLAVTAIVAVTLWILIWRRTVVWSRAAVGGTAITAVACLALPIGLLLLLEDYAADLPLRVLGCLSVIGWGVWMAVTVSFWPGWGERPVPQCMNCGYLLIGLSSTRCPECGDEPTLDELWQATAGAP